MRALLRRALACALIAASLGAPAAATTPYSVETLLGLEDLGTVAVSPGGRWLVIQAYAAHAQAERFDRDHQYRLDLGRLYRVDLHKPGPAQALTALSPAGGLTAGPFSPSGRRIAVSRLSGARWETGLVELATGQTRWLGFGVELPAWGRTLAWRSDEEFLAIATAPGGQPLYLRLGLAGRTDLPTRWQGQAEGRQSLTQVGSGRFLDRGSQAPPRRLLRGRVGGAVTTLLEGDLQDLEIAPGGRWAAVMIDGVDVQPVATDRVRGATPTRRRGLRIVDLQSGRVSAPCPACDLLPGPLTWAPDGETVLVAARREPGQTVLMTVEAKTGRVTALGSTVTPAMQETFEGVAHVQAGWIGAAPAVLGRLTADLAAPSRWIVLTARGPRDLAALPGPITSTLPTMDGVVALARGQAFRIDADGAALPLGPIVDPAAFAPATFGAPMRPWFNPFDNNDRGGLSLSLAQSQTPNIGGAILTRTGSGAASRDFDAHGVQRLEWIALDGTRTRLLTLNAQLSSVRAARLQAVLHKGPEGEALTSWLVLPADPLPAGGRWPLVVTPYPEQVFGPQAPEFALPGRSTLPSNPQILAAHGYAVLLPSLPRPVSTEPAAGLADQILAVVDAAARVAPVDSDRPALWGHSFGGWAALAAASQSPRFAAVIDTAGPSDLVSSWAVFTPHGRTHPQDGLSINGATGWLESGQFGLGATPWAAPARYAHNSPLLQADKITAPVLLAYGDQDPLGLSQGETMFSALYRQGKDARLMTFWGEGHVIVSPANLRALYTGAVDFLDGVFATAPRDSRATKTTDGPAGPAALSTSAPTAPAPPGSRPRASVPGG